MPNRLRIAILTYATQPRGGVLHALSLAEALHRGGDAVTLFALGSPGACFAREPRCPYHIIDVASRDEPLLEFVRRRVVAYVDALVMRREPFDVYHAHDGIGGAALARLAERGNIGSYMRTVHHRSSFGDERVDAIDERSIEGASRIFVVSRVWQRDVRERYGREATLVSNGVDTERFVPATPVRRIALRERFGGGSPLVVTIGGIEERKNSLALLDAFARVKARLPHARLVVVGGSSVLDHASYRAAFDARMREIGFDANDALEIRGAIDDEEIVALLQAADVFAFPSLVEGFGLVVLEALACGAPVVVSDREPFIDYLTRDEAAFADPTSPDDIARAICTLATTSEGERLRRLGPLVARCFSWERVARAHRSAYIDDPAATLLHA